MGDSGRLVLLIIYGILFGIVVKCMILVSSKPKKKKFHLKRAMSELSSDNNTISEFINIKNKIYTGDEYILIKNKRKMVLIYNVIFVLLFLISSYLIIVQLFTGSTNIIKYTPGIITFFIGVLAYSSYEKEKVNYLIMYKNGIVRKIVEEIRPEYKYKPFLSKNHEDTDKDSVSKIEALYIKSGFDIGKVDRVSCDDFIRDTNGKIKISDIKVEKYNSEKNSDYDTIFEGLFGAINLSKKVDMPIQLTTNNTLCTYNENRIEFEGIEFEKKFDIYCKDRLLACTIITPEVVEMLNDFYKRYNILFEINLIDDNIYLRLFTGKMFEPEYYSNTSEIETIFIYYIMLRFITDFSDKLKEIINEKL